MKPNIYLDIDGVILVNDKNGAAHVHEFLELITTNYPDTTYWLTTHCQGDVQTAVNRLRTVLEPKTIELLHSIKPTRWKVAKTEAVDFTKPFLVFEDDLYDEEREELIKHGVLDNWILIDLAKNEHQLADFISSFPIPINYIK